MGISLWAPSMSCGLACLDVREREGGQHFQAGQRGAPGRGRGARLDNALDKGFDKGTEKGLDRGLDRC